MTRFFNEAIGIFERQGGTLRMSDALASGLSRRTLYAMRDKGVVVQLSRGVYRLAALPDLGSPDLIPVCTRTPNGVVCLISALAFHGLTTQIPHAVDIALARGSSTPRIDYPPVTAHWFSGAAFASSVETPTVDGTKIRVYSAEKTVADVFKYRNKVGMDVALEALKSWRARRHPSVERLIEQARICRVERVMRPYLEGTTCRRTPQPLYGLA